MPLESGSCGGLQSHKDWCRFQSGRGEAQILPVRDRAKLVEGHCSSEARAKRSSDRAPRRNFPGWRALGFGTGAMIVSVMIESLLLALVGGLAAAAGLRCVQQRSHLDNECDRQR